VNADQKVFRLTRARMAGVLVCGTALLGGVSACGSGSQTTGSATGPATGVKKEAGIPSSSDQEALAALVAYASAVQEAADGQAEGWEQRLVEAQRLEEVDAEMEAAQDAADRVKADAEVQLTSGVVEGIVRLGVAGPLGTAPTGGSFPTQQVDAVRKELFDKQLAFVDDIKQDVEAVDVPSGDAKAQAARDDFAEALAAAQAQVDQALAQLEAQVP